MITVNFYTPTGNALKGEFDEIVVSDNKLGSFGILKNHIPVLSVIEKGYVFLKNKDMEKYVALIGAVFKFNDNDASIVCETLEIASTLEVAVNNLEKQLIDRKNSNRERNVELAMAENELKKQIKKTGAGSL